MRIPAQSGMTLIELLLALALIGLLLTLSAGGVGDWIRDSRVGAVAGSIQNGLLLAREEAVRRNTRVSFQLLTAGSTSSCQPGWKVVGGKTLIQSQSAGDAVGAVSVTVTFNGAPDPACGLLVFNGLGQRPADNTEPGVIEFEIAPAGVNGGNCASGCSWVSVSAQGRIQLTHARP